MLIDDNIVTVDDLIELNKRDVARAAAEKIEAARAALMSPELHAYVAQYASLQEWLIGDLRHLHIMAKSTARAQGKSPDAVAEEIFTPLCAC